MRKILNSLIIIFLFVIVGVVAYIFLFKSTPVEKIILNKKEINIFVGEKDKIIVTIEPTDATDKKITWKSNNLSVATVSENGVVNGISEGEADINILSSNEKVKESCHVVVKAIEVERIELSETEISLQIGDKKELSAISIPDNATYPNLVYQSSDESIATINQNGVIEAIKDGVVDIIVHDEKGKVEAKCKVVVGIPLDKIELNKTSVSLTIGKEDNLTAILTPTNATNIGLTWSSSNEGVATVDNYGKITATGVGEAIIKVSSVNGKNATCKVTVNKEPILVSSVVLNKTSVNLEVGKTIELIAAVSPSNADNKDISWKSSNENVAVVDQNGKVVAKGKGSAIITATSNGKSASCTIIIKSDPIVPSSVNYKYEGSTFKYYIQNKSGYYLSYIWMEDPYNQIKKIDANVAEYGKVMTDEEQASEGKKLKRNSVGTMMNAYISNGMISKDKAALGFNASGFYVQGAWNPPADYYNLRSDSWLVITDGKVVRKRIGDEKIFWPQVIGITSSGTLKVYDQTYNKNNGKKIYEEVMADKVQNTWSFYPELIRNGKVVVNDTRTAKRQAICQIDANNYVMYTSINNVSHNNVVEVFSSIGCQTAFNLDGGGSTSLFYKKPGNASVSKIKCSDGSSHDVCRSIVEGIYFVEK